MLISKENAEGMRRNYIGYLENSRDQIRKNYNEMDIENVELVNKINAIVSDSEAAINSAISRIEHMYFQ